jgi:hypothetical protein
LLLDFLRQAGQIQVASYFEAALRHRRVSHGYVFLGSRAGDMYATALYLAQRLNCQRPVDAWTACGACQPCQWIANNAHPAVVTISRLTYQVDAQSGAFLEAEALNRAALKAGQPTQIKAEQISALLRQLAQHAGAQVRVVIFTDVEVWAAAEDASALQPEPVLPPLEWRSLTANNKKHWQTRPLQRALLNEASANRFLKTLEEPPANTVFIFLAEAEGDLLETIVSRAQVLTFCATCLQNASSEAAAWQTLLPEPLQSKALEALWQDNSPFASGSGNVDRVALAQTLDEAANAASRPVQVIHALQAGIRAQYWASVAQHPVDFRHYVRVQQRLQKAASYLHSKVYGPAVWLQLL